MPHQRFCKICRGWHDLAEPWPDNCRPAPAQRSSLPAPMVISDSLDYVEHPLDGRKYTSKALFRQTTRANGYEEVGNDPARLKTKIADKPDARAIRDALGKAEARFQRGERIRT